MVFSRFFQFLQRYFFPDGEPVFLQRCGRVFLWLFFAALFVPLKLHVYQAPIFFGGDFNSYQNFFLYLSDIFFLGAFFTFSIHFFRYPKELGSLHFGHRYLLFFWLSLLTLGEISVFLSPDPTLSFLLFLRLVQSFLLYIVVCNQLLPLRTIFLVVIFGLLGEAMLGLYQYVHGGSAGLSFLGEPVLSTAMTGVSTLDVAGHKVLRAYGTFLHPNILAAYLLFGLFALKNVYRRNPYPCLIIAFMMVVGLLVTFSRTAFLAGLAFVGVYYFLTRRRPGVRVTTVSAVVLLFFLVSLNIGSFFIERFQFHDTQALQFRTENMIDGVRLFVSHPLGVGLGASSMAVQDVVVQKLSPWEYQPAHNLFLIVSNELGLAGLALFIFLFFWITSELYRRRSIAPELFALWVMVAILSCTDHYFFSLYHGVMLFTLVLGVVAFSLHPSVHPSVEEDSTAP